ncbi:NUDIX hydrolase domain protein [Kalmanozyma brasiliensis GHG001]|uniref:NUDIX hydrolase domain protein n=1 Tax=Kalmanozyma brasiliensis (strain GHG001) TaxID=1365824 RepID=UPI0028680853|nr:NUDIX hydrolase domain protein [Kalmanozyma brasiliensis GHG001]EST05566.2 NUDIX hydrolase domain protein [Kalmanozyma brasiliensis GHG001]
MPRSAEWYALLESGTSRLHFKLVKELEEASTSRHHDTIILATVTPIGKQLASRSFSSDVGKLASALLTLLHCVQHYPCSAASVSDGPATIDISFALLPTLQLLSLATSWKQLLVAYQLLPFLLPRNEEWQSRDEKGSPPLPNATTSRRASTTEDDSSALLLLNTFRINLSAASDQAQQVAPSQHSDRSTRTKRGESTSTDDFDWVGFKALLSLKSLITGTPQGPAVLSSLASTLVALTRHPDSSLRCMTLNAMLSCAKVPPGESVDLESRSEMLEAALTIVHLTLASTYAFSAGADTEEQHGMIMAEMERRADSNPNVLRACIRIVHHCRAVGLITDAEAANHALEALQAAGWAPMHLDIPLIEQQNLASTVADRTRGIRARTAARQRSSLQTEHDYYGSYAPWLVDACLSLCTSSIESMSKQTSSMLRPTARTKLLRTVLLIYHTASQGRAAALALCVSAARCIGALHVTAFDKSRPETSASSASAGDYDAEVEALWAMLSAHVKSQLHSSNPNRKTAAIRLLDALLPVGWARANSVTDAGQIEARSPLNIEEADMGQLMTLLADSDASIRKRALALLHRVDSNLIGLLRSQLQAAVDYAMSVKTNSAAGLTSDKTDGALIATAQRLVEVALFAVASQIDAASSQEQVPNDALADLEVALTSGVALDLFGNFTDSASSERHGWLSSDATRALLELQVNERTEDSTSISSSSSDTSLLAAATQFFSPSSRASSRPDPAVDRLTALGPRSQLPDSILRSSHLLSPDNNTDTLRSTRHNSSGNRRDIATRRSRHENLQHSAIPSESKRVRDRGIAKAMSDSIANLVLGADARTQSSDNEVIFSATSSGILEAEELDVVHEVADPERRLDYAVAKGETPSLLDLVHHCHNHDPWLDTSLTPFVLDGVQIGFLPARVVKACVGDSARQVRAGAPPVLRKVRFVMTHREILPPTTSSRTCEAITFTAGFATPEARTTGLNAVAQRWREARIFPDPLDGWRDELYAIYGLNPRPGTRNPIAFKLERAACALFGFATFGVHLTAYITDPNTGELKVWVPQRSSTKSTWPGYLDNSVAGGIVAGDLQMESMVRECEEEANLDSDLVEKHIKQTGVLSYCYKTAKQGWIQPEVEYVYDLPLPSDVTLQPKDGEVDHFELMTLEEVYEKMREGRFKANCVLVILDFLIRHGHITADKEAGYRQIVAQLHVDLRLPGP